MKWYCTILLILAGCSSGTQMTRTGRSETLHISSDTLHFIFLGHAYSWQGNGMKVDRRVEKLDYGRYARIFLGGDVCSEAFLLESTVKYIDSLFGLGKTSTNYTMGNHDARNENEEWYLQYTGRKTYYSYFLEGITVVVLNSTLNPGDCEQLDDQYDMLHNVCDTIASSSHLLILQHHSTFRDVPGLPQQWSYCNWPLPFWNANCHMAASQYVDAVYPLLVAVRNRGIRVINVIGDAGVLEKGRSMLSSDSIWYISSGINNSKFENDSLALDTIPKDKVLIFKHVPTSRQLSWEFQDLDSLYLTHQ